MEPAVEVATRLDYRISGTFDEVVVEEMTRAKKKIKVEYASEKPLDEEPSGEATDNQPNESLQPVPKLPVSDQKIESEPESQEKVVPETSKHERNDEEVDVKPKEKEPDPDPLEV